MCLKPIVDKSRVSALLYGWNDGSGRRVQPVRSKYSKYIPYWWTASASQWAFAVWTDELILPSINSTVEHYHWVEPGWIRLSSSGKIEYYHLVAAVLNKYYHWVAARLHAITE